MATKKIKNKKENKSTTGFVSLGKEALVNVVGGASLTAAAPAPAYNKQKAADKSMVA